MTKKESCYSSWCESSFFSLETQARNEVSGWLGKTQLFGFDDDFTGLKYNFGNKLLMYYYMYILWKAHRPTGVLFVTI